MTSAHGQRSCAGLPHRQGGPARVARMHPTGELEPLDLTQVGTLTFEAPNEELFPSTRICREAIQAGGGAPAILNAANEIAVGAFLDGRVGFLQITALVEETLDKVAAAKPGSLEDVLALDALARAKAKDLLEQRS